MLLEDIDRAPADVLPLLVPLLEKGHLLIPGTIHRHCICGIHQPHSWIFPDGTGRSEPLQVHPNFRLFSTVSSRSRSLAVDHEAILAFRQALLNTTGPASNAAASEEFPLTSLELPEPLPPSVAKFSGLWVRVWVDRFQGKEIAAVLQG